MIKIPSKKVIKSNQPIATEKVSEETIDLRPSFAMTEEVYPEIKNWTVGKKYKLEIEVEMTGIGKIDWGNDKGKYRAEFKISGIAEDDYDDEEGYKNLANEKID